MQEELSLQEKNVITYIGGYIVKKLKQKVPLCESCLNKLICTDCEELNNSRFDFLKAKNYIDAKEGLQKPSSLLTDALEQCEIHYCKIIDDCIYLDGTKAALVSSIMNHVKFGHLMCETCKVHNVIVYIMVNIRLHHTIRQANVKLRDQKDRKNRKTMKFSHI